MNELHDIEELQSILTLYEKAKGYLAGFKWCLGIANGWYDPKFCVFDKVGVFRLEIKPIDETVDKLIWVIVGDLPSVYLDAGIKTSKQALTIYCELMREWADDVIQCNDLNNSYPVQAEPTLENAQLLIKKIEFIRIELLS